MRCYRNMSMVSFAIPKRALIFSTLAICSARKEQRACFVASVARYNCQITFCNVVKYASADQKLMSKLKQAVLGMCEG